MSIRVTASSTLVLGGWLPQVDPELRMETGCAIQGERLNSSPTPPTHKYEPRVRENSKVGRPP